MIITLLILLVGAFIFTTALILTTTLQQINSLPISNFTFEFLPLHYSFLLVLVLSLISTRLFLSFQFDIFEVLFNFLVIAAFDCLPIDPSIAILGVAFPLD